MRVPVVDDDAVSLKLVTSLLERNQFEAAAKESAKEAINLLRKEGRADLINSRILVAGADGYITKPFYNTRIAERIELFVRWFEGTVCEY